MSLTTSLDAHLASLVRWLERSEDVVVLVVGPGDDLRAENRAFLKRCGRRDSCIGINLPDLLQSDSREDGFLPSPKYGAPVQQLLTAAADQSTWQCAIFPSGDDERLLIGALQDGGRDDFERRQGVLASDLASYQRHLTRANRELRVARDGAEQQLATDLLTDVASRRALAHRQKIEIARAERHGCHLSLIVCDIDHFKKVNDDHGHAAGDEVLRNFGGILIETTRPTDLPARPGGEEFAVLVPDTNLDNATVLAERIRASVEGCFLPAIGRSVTASFGVAQWKKDESLAEWEARADEALYRAKDKGRNCVESAK